MQTLWEESSGVKICLQMTSWASGEAGLPLQSLPGNQETAGDTVEVVLQLTVMSLKYT